MKVTVIHMAHPADTESESVRVAEVTIPQRVPYGAHGSWIQN